MPNFEPLFYLNYESAGYDQYSTNEDNDSTYRLPPDYMTSGNHDTDKAPVIYDLPTGFGYNVKGLHANINSANNGRASAVWYDPNKIPSVNVASFVMVRLGGGFTNIGVGPAVRIQTAANPGKSCYCVEFLWVTTGPSDGYLRLEIVKYDSGGTRSVLGTLTNAITKYPVNSSPANFGNRYYAVGLKATGTGGTVTLTAYLHMMYYTQDPSYNPFAPGTTPPRNLKNLPPTTPVVLTATDSSSPLTTGTAGIRWRDAAASFDTTSFTWSRLAVEHALFIDIASTRPTTPSIISITQANGTRATVLIQGFSDPDPVDSHDSTRWLLYEDDPFGQNEIPIRDTGFLTGYLTSYTFTDLAPGKRYKAQAQFKDGDGDISVLSSVSNFVMIGGRPKGYLAAIDFHESMAHSFFPRNITYEIYVRPGITNSTPVFKLRNSGYTVNASPLKGRGPTIRRFNSVSAGQFRGIAYRDPSLLPGQPGSRYLQIMGTSVFIKWGDATGVSIGVRCTAVDIDGYYVKKQASGANWNYVVYQRTLNSGGTPGTGPYTNTTIFTGSVPQVGVGAQGERVILVSYDVGGTPNLALFVNGILLGSASGSSVSQGYSDPGHMYSAIMIDDTNGDFDIQSYGQVDAISGNLPELPITIYTPDRNTGQIPGGTAMSQPGPYMDPFDYGDSFTAWFSSGSKWCYQDPTGNIVGFLVYWAPYLADYDYTVRAAIYNKNGLVARFTDSKNYVAAYVDTGGTTIVLAFVVGGVVAQYHHAVVADYAEGNEMFLQVVNDITSGSTAILARVYYNGSLKSFGPTGGGAPYTNTYITYDGGSASPLRSGRPGILRNSQNGSTTGQYIAANFSAVSATAINPPNQPTIVSKSGDAATKISVVLTGSSFSDPDATSVHTHSQWQIAIPSDPSFSSVVFDSGSTGSNLTSITVAPGVGTWSPSTNPGLNALSTYLARVRYQDDLGLWSPWSTTYVFVTDDSALSVQALSVLGTYPTDPKPAQSYDEEITYNTLVTQYSSKRTQAIAKWTGSKRLFRLTYGPISSTQMDVLWDFFQEMSGKLNLFTYVDFRSGNSYICRFAQDNMSRSMIEYEIEQSGLVILEA